MTMSYLFIPFSHIPPYDGQMADHRENFHELMLKNDIHVSVHGHKHDFSLMDLYGGGVQYLSISSPQKRTYVELSITPTAIDIQKIEF
jgi:3',5'-cyclic-AMP phosphodiesterase